VDNREMLLKRIQVCDFVLFETHLYLDSHPTDAAALDHYKKYRDMKKMAAEEFVDKYGPLTGADAVKEDRWTWVDDPWPWEKEAN